MALVETDAEASKESWVIAGWGTVTRDDGARGSEAVSAVGSRDWILPSYDAEKRGNIVLSDSHLALSEGMGRGARHCKSGYSD